MKLGTKIAKKIGNSLERAHWSRQNRRAKIPSWCRNILFSKREAWETFIRTDFKLHPEVNIKFGEMTVEDVQAADIVIPYEYSDLVWLSERPWLTENKRIPIPNRQVVDLCHDKHRFNTTLIELGFGALIPAEGESLTPPYIVKPNQGESSVGTFVVTSFDSEIRNAEELKKPGNLKQKMILGKCEYATHMVVGKGKLLAELTIEYRFEKDMPVKGIDETVWKRTTRCHDTATLLDVLNKIGFEGICCFNYKVAEGQMQLIELNPRFGGSLSSHFTYMLTQMA
jgi:predicted ATP-grasp superfamily ATP-dependent carboligase